MADQRVMKGMAAQLEMRRERLSSGARHIGWKVGFGSRAAMERLAINSPLFGFLTDRGIVESGSSVSIAGWTRAVFEPEVAVHLGSSLRSGAGEADVRAAIAGLGPAVELADIDPAVKDVDGILACNIFHRHVLVGPIDRTRAGGSIMGIEGRVLRDGQEIAHAADATAPGDVVVLLQALADVLEENGESLRAGELVITGSLVPPIDVAPGQVLRAEISPLGEIEVRFQEVTA
jgi:2-keto-4-pentenoate hydratase